MKGRFACIFPGQGSQSVGMLDDWVSRYSSEVRDLFASASKQLGYDLLALIEKGPAEQLNQTIYTQPAMLMAGVIAYQIFRKNGGNEPYIAAGHSLGEYSALVAAQALSLDDAVNLVSHRARLMQQAVPQGEGAMAAIIGLDEAQINELCQQAAQGRVVAPANYNAIGQIVIAGHKDAVQRAIELSESKNVKLAKIIPISVPCHCQLLRDAADEFTSFLDNTAFHRPKFPVVSNVDVELHQHPDDIRDSLHRQIYHPVRWVEVIHRIAAEENIDIMLECGPGRVLTGLNKRMGQKLKTYPIYDHKTLEQAVNSTILDVSR